MSVYPIFPDQIPEIHLTSGNYSATFAKTQAELEEVQRLRFAVFNLELGEGLDSSFASQMDQDDYDAQCHHLIVRDDRSGELVGTYRMQSESMGLSTGKGFYSGAEFDLSHFPEGLLTQSLELGRACIASEHRSGRVLFLLWRGFFNYLRANNLRYMFGCCSLNSQSPEEGWALFTRLERAGHLRMPFLIPARPAFACPRPPISEEQIADTILPRLMSLYIDYGASICSEPALDREFKTIDFLTLLDLQSLPQKMLKVFSQDFAP